MKLDKNLIWILIGCLVPLMMLFFAPALGITNNAFIMFFLTALFLIHYYFLTNLLRNQREQTTARTNKTMNLPATKGNMRSFSKIDIKQFALAIGITGSFVYMGCILFMLTMEQEGTVHFFNSILHGLDTSAIIRMQVPWWEALMGIAETFIISWLVGAVIAAVYNISGQVLSDN